MAQTKSVYGLNWQKHLADLEIEIQMCRKGGRWRGKTGVMFGEGLFFHFRRAMQLMWPDIVWHKWNNLIVEQYCDPKIRTIAILGPASCVAGHTRILNPLTGEQPTISELCETKTAPVVMTLSGPVLACVPFVKGLDDLYEVTLANGCRFQATALHRVLTPDGYKSVSDLPIGQFLVSYGEFRRASTSDTSQPGSLSSVPGSQKKVQDSGDGYRPDCHSDGEQPRSHSGNVPSAFPSPSDIPARNAYPAFGRAGVSDNTPEHNRLHPRRDRLSTGLIGHLSNYTETLAFRHGASKTLSLDGVWSQRRDRSLSETYPEHSSSRPLPNGDYRPTSSFSYEHDTVQPSAVTSVTYVGRAVFYDLCVPDVHHYFAEGAIHHNSGKTHTAALCGISDYFIFPECTTVIVCSTTKELLEQRVFGEIKRLWRTARRRYSWLPGHLIEGRMRIVTDSREDMDEGRDFINGVLGVPIKKGNDYVGLGDFAGMKNKRVILLGDELSLLPPAFIHAISNLDKNTGLKVMGLGNPKDPMDALGMLAEPAAHLGGWDGGIDQSPGTKSWETRRQGGVCVQLPGDDSPNLDGKLGAPLITQEAIDRDVSFYGTDSLWVSMMDQGRMPRGLGSRRVLTREMCRKFHAFDEPNWLDGNRTRIAFLDAAYGGTGGDRCIFGELQFGREVAPLDPSVLAGSVVNQRPIPGNNRQILALIDTTLVPVSSNFADLPCDQIVNFCRAQCESRGIPPENFFYEAGMRAALVQAFARLWSSTTNALDCMGTASQDRKVSANIDVLCCDYYANKITEMWYSVHHIVESGQWRNMTDGPLMEFCQREWGYVGKNKIQVEPKKDMKKKTGRSPDEADSVATGVEGAIQRGFIIERLKSVRQAVRDDRWKRDLREKAKTLWRKELNHAA